MKLDSSGNFVWAKTIGNDQHDNGYAIGIDDIGNLYITGSFSFTVDFDPGPGTFNIASSGLDTFILKLDSDGDFIWAKSMGGTNITIGLDIAVDGAGNVHTTGRFDGTTDFDPGAGVAELTGQGQANIFVIKLDPSGNFVWAKSMGGTGFDHGFGIAVDPSGNVCTTGYFFDTVDFDPGPGTLELTAPGAANIANIFVQKLDSNGDLVWAHGFGDTGHEIGSDIATDASGNVYTIGYFNQTVDFDPGPDIVNLTPPVSSASFLQKLDSSGKLVSVVSFGGTETTLVSGIAIDSESALYLRGNFKGTTDFDPGLSLENRTSMGVRDSYILKLTQMLEVNSIVPTGTSPVNRPFVKFKVRFSQSVTGVDATDFVIDATGVTGAFVSSLYGIGSTYIVVVDTGTGDGTLSIDLIDDDSIIDSEGTPLNETGLGNGNFTTAASYTLDRSLPLIMPVGGFEYLVLLTGCMLFCGYFLYLRRNKSK